MRSVEGVVLAAERRMTIADEVRNSGLVTVRDLAIRLDVSEVTIRRDLEEIEQAGDVIRVHGGAVHRARGTSFEPGWAAKVGLRHAAKQRIGEVAARRIRPNETILLDSGTTTLCVARAIRVPAVVFVADVKIAVELASRPASDAIRTVMVGGEVRRGLFSTMGRYAAAMLDELHVDRAFLSADAIDVTAGITNATVEGTQIKKAIVASANEVVLVADASKVGTVVLSKVASLSDIDVWITDDEIDPEVLERVRDTGLTVEVV